MSPRDHQRVPAGYLPLVEESDGALVLEYPPRWQLPLEEFAEGAVHPTTIPCSRARTKAQVASTAGSVAAARLFKRERAANAATMATITKRTTRKRTSVSGARLTLSMCAPACNAMATAMLRLPRSNIQAITTDHSARSAM